jgi:hypothetical protein
MNAKEFNRELEDRAKILESALNNNRVDRKTIELWIYNKVREIKQNSKGRKVTFSLHIIKAALKNVSLEKLAKMYVKMKLIESKRLKKQKWKKRKIPGMNS